jgi:electron transfer flavoprotein beta subunit
MNRFDEFALEEALLIRERRPDTLVHALSVGPERVRSTLRRALGLGADHGIHILNPTEGWISPFTVASWIAAYARTKDYDLILTGVMAEDDMEGQVGPLLAEFLSMTCSTSIISLGLSPEEKAAQVERETEGGVREIIRLTLPALLTIQSGMNRPRYPSLSGVLRAHRQDLEVVSAGSLSAEDPRQETLGFSYPSRARTGSFLSGTAREKAETLVKLLRAKSLLS